MPESGYNIKISFICQGIYLPLICNRYKHAISNFACEYIEG